MFLKLIEHEIFVRFYLYWHTKQLFTLLFLLIKNSNEITDKRLIIKQLVE